MSRNRLALLRGVNVGGANKVPMAELRAMAERLGWEDVATHVNSGNLVFTAPGPPDEQEAALAAEVAQFLGKPVQTLVLEAQDWIDAVEDCPFTPSEDKFVHVQVHRHDLPSSVVAALESAVTEAADGTEVVVRGRWLYLHTPMGLSKSVVFKQSPKVVMNHDPGTARNLNSAKAIVRLLRA